MRAQSRGQFSEINITPLTDIFLVLLIIMMVAAPMMEFTGLRINVPETGKEGVSDEKPKLTRVTVQKDDTFKIDQQILGKEDIAKLVEQLKEKAAVNTDGVVIRVNDDSSHEALTQALAAVGTAGIQKVSLVKEEQTAASPAEPSHTPKPRRGKK